MLLGGLQNGYVLITKLISLYFDDLHFASFACSIYFVSKRLLDYYFQTMDKRRQKHAGQRTEEESNTKLRT